MFYFLSVAFPPCSSIISTCPCVQRPAPHYALQNAKHERKKVEIQISPRKKNGVVVLFWLLKTARFFVFRSFLFFPVDKGRGRGSAVASRTQKTLLLLLLCSLTIHYYCCSCSCRVVVLVRVCAVYRVVVASETTSVVASVVVVVDTSVTFDSATTGGIRVLVPTMAATAATTASGAGGTSKM